MSNIAIKIENLSKQYRLGVIGTGTLSHDLNRWWRMKILGKEDPFLKIGETNQRDTKGTSDYVWALRDINLEVKKGEVLGIIGKNGAGKSTLLKILSRVTKPTTGKITYKGRIASLLEVGTGFHPEMTGRENIYMNGTIMGMTRSEISRKLDEIVDFAGIERYIDTPVKRYSSGMTVRLGFAIAAHLEPEILVVDEVLAVGDAEFQKKAIGKMQDVSKGEGRTVLFVSHNMGAVRSLCNSGLVLGNGEIIVKGSVEKCIETYLFDLDQKMVDADLTHIPRAGNGDLIITGFHVENTNGLIISRILSGEDIQFVFSYEKKVDFSIDNISLGFSIHNNSRDTLSILYSDYSNDLFEIRDCKGSIKCLIKSFPFLQGRYFIGLRVIRGGVEIDYPKDLISYIDVENGNFYFNTNITHSGSGAILIRGEWSNVNN
ncbi:MAG: ABC transporter ATP-binding protein [Bacteroidales bacterium]|nr:ABC transporter ATP-binding protein [Bacteroidales bacterium]